MTLDVILDGRGHLAQVACISFEAIEHIRLVSVLPITIDGFAALHELYLCTRE